MRTTVPGWRTQQSIAAMAALALAGFAAVAMAQTPVQKASPSATPVKAAPGKLGKPLWRSLSAPQQAALQPLRAEWDALDGVRKRKWLELAHRFAAMSPAEQQRVHQRMREWIKLTPAQRSLARQNYTRTRQIAPGKKSATWQSYQQLPEHEKKKLAAAARQKKPAASAGKSATAAQPAAKPSTPAPALPASPTTTPVAPAITAPNAN